MSVLRAIDGKTEESKKALSLSLSLVLVFMALVTAINQAAGEELVKGILTLGQGYNFVALPCANTSFTASSFLDALGDAAQSISYYDPLTQSYVTYDRNLARFAIQEDFPIQPDIGYVVYSADNCSTSIAGIHTATRSIHLHPGYNLVGWSSPAKSDPITAFVNPSNGAVQSVSAFNESSQQYVTYNVALASYGIPQPDFRMSQGHACFVFSNASCTLQYADAPAHATTSSPTPPQPTTTQTTSTTVRGIQTNGTNFVSNGEDVTLCGVHMTLWDDSDKMYKEKYFDWLKSYGINSIMLDFGWNKLEPTKGVYNQSYLDRMDRFIEKAKSRGIYVILRMLKWSYPNAYQAQRPDNQWILGYPAWLDNTPDFWENVGNCWDNYIAMWTMLTRRYKNEPYVAGYELNGEPGNDIGPGIYDAPGEGWDSWDSNTCRKVMGVLFDKDKLYERTINAIHSISDKFVVIEGFAYGVLGYIKNPGDSERTPAQRPNSQNFAVSQTVYEWCQFKWLDGQIAITNSWNVPFLASEFGVKVDVIKSPPPEKVSWVEQACQAFARRKMSWFYWGFGPGRDDFNLVDETDDSVSPILSNILSAYTFGLLPTPH